LPISGHGRCRIRAVGTGHRTPDHHVLMARADGAHPGDGIMSLRSSGNGDRGPGRGESNSSGSEPGAALWGVPSDGEGMASSLPARSIQERPHPEFQRREPDQAPGEAFLEGLPGEVVVLRSVPRHDPVAAGVVDPPGAVTATRSDRRTLRVKRSATFQGGIDAGLGHGAGDTPSVIRGQDRTLACADHVSSLPPSRPAR
jgi:hypothetical protein